MIEVSSSDLSKEEADKLLLAIFNNNLFLEIEIKFSDGTSKFIYKRAYASAESMLHISLLEEFEIVGDEELLGDNDNALIITRCVARTNICETKITNGVEFKKFSGSAERLHFIPDKCIGYITKGCSWTFR